MVRASQAPIPFGDLEEFQGAEVIAVSGNSIQNIKAVEKVIFILKNDVVGSECAAGPLQRSKTTLGQSGGYLAKDNPEPMGGGLTHTWSDAEQD